MNTARRKRNALAGFCALALPLYTYGILSASFIPAYVEEIALPLDFMVGIPLGFFFLVVKLRKLTLLSVIPIVWVGYTLSALALGSPNAGALPYLLIALIPIELAIAVRECRKLANIYRAAKAKSADPMIWLRETMLYLVRKDALANMAATELAVWYYTLFSWRKKPRALPCEKTFSYHNVGGYTNMMLGLALAFPVEIIAVHILLSRWSISIAIAVTIISAYAVIWLIGDARARILRPITISDSKVHLECGIQMQATISLAEIEAITFSEKDVAGIAKSDKLNYGTFFQANVWVVTKRPIEIRTILGKKRARAIGLSLDDPNAFARAAKLQ